MSGALFAHIGGKNRSLGAELAALLPKQKPNIYIEPFGGSFGLGIQSGYDPNDVIMIHNDLDNVIHAIFKAVTYDPEKTLDEVCYLMDTYGYSQETVDYFGLLLAFEKATGENLFKDDIALGAAAWILKTITYNGNCRTLRTSQEVDPVSGVINKFERRGETANCLKGVRVMKEDALELLEDIKEVFDGQEKDVMLYVDAPYSHSGKRKTKGDLYRVDIDKNDQVIEKLAETLEELNKCTDCKIMVSEYDNPIYNKTLTRKNGWEKVKVCDVHKSMSVSDRYGNKPIETEYVWRNYNEYGKLISHIIKTADNQVGETPMASKESSVAKAAKSKYTVEVSFLGTADDKQVEEEVTAILKDKFLAKMTSCNSESVALESTPDNEKY